MGTIHIRSAVSALIVAFAVTLHAQPLPQGGGRGGRGGAINFVAFDPANGKPLWHTQIGQVTNAPETYMVDGRQHVLVAAGDTLYAFALYQ